MNSLFIQKSKLKKIVPVWAKHFEKCSFAFVVFYTREENADNIISTSIMVACEINSGPFLSSEDNSQTADPSQRLSRKIVSFFKK